MRGLWDAAARSRDAAGGSGGLFNDHGIQTSISIPLRVGRNFPTWFPMGPYFNVLVWILRTCMLLECSHQACDGQGELSDDCRDITIQWQCPIFRLHRGRRQDGITGLKLPNLGIALDG